MIVIAALPNVCEGSVRRSGYWRQWVEPAASKKYASARYILESRTSCASQQESELETLMLPKQPDQKLE